MHDSLTPREALATAAFALAVPVALALPPALALPLALALPFDLALPFALAGGETDDVPRLRRALDRQLGRAPRRAARRGRGATWSALRAGYR